MTRPVPAFDIVIGADFRIGDSGSRLAAGYVRAAADAGYAIAVLQIFGSAPHASMALDASWTPLLSKSNVSWISADTACTARLFLGIDLRLFGNRSRTPCRVTAQRRMVVVTRSIPGGRAAAQKHLDNAEDFFADSVTLAPAASPIRSHLAANLPRADIAAHDCPPVLTVLSQPKPARRVTLPAVGFFRENMARSGVPEDLRSVLPAHPLIELKVLGLPDSAERQLAQTPNPVVFWKGRDAIPDFLRSIDFFSLGDDARSDPFPVELLAALEAGVIPLLPPEYRGIFMSAAVYVTPKTLADTVVDLFAAPEIMDDLRAAGREILEGVFAPGLFVDQLQHWIGAPGPQPVTTGALLRARQRILSLSTNGIGMGHLSRQLAVAERLKPEMDTVFLSLSQAVSVVRRFGYVSEHVPSFQSIGLDPGYWNRALAAYLISAIEFYRPAGLMVDANHPFAGLNNVRNKYPGMPMIWMRRGMWRVGHEAGVLGREGLFDLILEPGEIAGDYDDGPTAGRTDTVHLSPVTLVDASMQRDRATACAELGISADTLNVLLMPGAQNNFETGFLWSAILAELDHWPGTTSVLCEWQISDAENTWPPSLPRVRGFPFSIWFRAFDFAISAAGYNSFTELIALGVPAVFVPNEHASMDRQELRSLYAERHGLGAMLRAEDAAGTRSTLAPFREASFRQAIVQRQRRTLTASGAKEAARHIAHLVHSVKAHHPSAWTIA